MDIEFEGELWVWHSTGASWVFVTVPREISEQVREQFPVRQNGFGSVKVAAKVNGVEWSTSIWPDKKSGCFWLAIKAQVRKKAKIGPGDSATFSLHVLDQG
jgi:hypothetical protein